MANHMRSAKSASSWDVSELDAYNITILEVGVQSFFDVQELPPVPIEGDFVNFQRENDMKDLTDLSLAFHMHEVMLTGEAEPDLIVFATKLLERIGYTSRTQQLKLCQDLPLSICSETTHSKTDISLVNVVCQQNRGHMTILLVEEHKRSGSADPIAQLIADAIAAAAVNNRARQERGMRPLSQQTIPAIILLGTVPTFYKIPVTTSLMNAVSTGQFPPTRTVVQRYSPSVQLGMIYLEDRKSILRCYKAFRKFIDDLDVALSAEE